MGLQVHEKGAHIGYPTESLVAAWEKRGKKKTVRAVLSVVIQQSGTGVDEFWWREPFETEKLAKDVELVEEAVVVEDPEIVRISR